MIYTGNSGSKKYSRLWKGGLSLATVASLLTILQYFEITPRNLITYFKPGTDSQPNKVFICNPIQKKHYVKRKREMSDVQRRFKSLRKSCKRNVPVAVCVTGKPGYGKTQFALEFAWVSREKSAVVATLNATNESTLFDSYIDLWDKLKDGNDKRKRNELHSLKEVSQEVKLKLERHPGWVIVIDNLSAGVRSLWETYCPKPGSSDWGEGFILVTGTDCCAVVGEDHSDHVKLGEMAKEDAIHLLKVMSSIDEDSKAKIFQSVARYVLFPICTVMFHNYPVPLN